MKQYQISYENRTDFSSRLKEIKSICDSIGCSDVTFYITWADTIKTELVNLTEEIENCFPESAYYGNEASGSIIAGNLSFGISITCYVFEGKSTKTELVWVEQGTPLSTLDDLWNYCNEK